MNRDLNDFGNKKSSPINVSKEEAMKVLNRQNSGLNDRVQENNFAEILDAKENEYLNYEQVNKVNDLVKIVEVKHSKKTIIIMALILLILIIIIILELPMLKNL